MLRWLLQGRLLRLLLGCLARLFGLSGLLSLAAR
jgi:hypothetical protein